ncbi:TPA: outer membrane protein assembly factor BamA [Candidatus Poribacteria bacterium]|nr:outer membrane protein assembly factor BamA [Candidatus Poribacteria bacterium]
MSDLSLITYHSNMAQRILSLCILIGLVCVIGAVYEPSLLAKEDKVFAEATRTEQQTIGQLIKYTKFVGNQKLGKSIIRQAISSKAGSRYDEVVIREDRKRIAELYRQHGYFQTQVTVESRVVSGGIVLTFNINEGMRYTIKDILFEGNRIADDERLMNQLKKTKVGHQYEPKKLNDDIMRLKEFYKKLRQSDGTFYSFPTVAIESEVEYISSENNVTIKISITEGVQAFYQFSGDEHIKPKHLLKDLPLLERGNLSRFTLKKSVEEIKEKYRKKGYYNVKVTYEMIQKPPQSVIFNFHINAGKPVYIAEIQFEGNNSIPKKELRKRMATQPRSFFAAIPILRRWVSKGIYDENTLTTDLHALNLLYERQGYRQVEIPNLKEIQLQIRGNRIYLLIPIKEGPQLRVKAPPKFEFIGGPPREGSEQGDFGRSHVFSETEIDEIRRNYLTTKEGQPYNPDTLLKDEIYLRSRYGEEGYVHAQIESSFHDGIVTFKINEGRQAFLGELRFFGNAKTEENVLKREFLVKEGEPFNTAKIFSKTQQRLYALGLFSSVVFEPSNTESEKIDLFVKLTERRMNSFDLSGGYNPSEGWNVSIETFHKNLFGRGRQLGLKFSQGRIGSRYEANFMEPWLLNTRTRSVIRIFRDNLEEQDDVLAKGGSIGLSRDWDDSSVALKYQYQLIDQSELLKRLNLHNGLSTISSVELSFRRDKRDFFLSPSKGLFNEINLEYAGGPLLRGDNSFSKLSSDVRYYRPVKSSVLAFALRTGYARGLRLTKNIISLERFQAGGSTTVRGYPERSLGPTDEFGLHRGDIEFIFNAELRFPIYNVPFPKEGRWTYLPRKIGGVVFFDTGNVWGKFEEIKETWLASAIGFGFRIDTPIGPIRLDYGYPLEERFRRKWWRQTHFALGHAF